MKRVRGRTKAKLPICTEILLSENMVVRAIEKKVIDIPLKIIAIRKGKLLAPDMKSVKKNVSVRRKPIRNVKIS